MKEEVVIHKLIIFLFFFLFCASFVSANFVCGYVHDSEQEKAGWFTVTSFYTSQPERTTQCKVSPQDNKYCCDALDIKSPWAIGKNISALIIDQERGYFSSRVQTLTTGEGFSIFPDIYLKKALNIINPQLKAYYNISSLQIQVHSSDPYNKLIYNLSSDASSQQEILCEQCNQINLSLSSLSPGFYSLIITANDLLSSFSEQRNFTILNEVSFKRKFDCDKCNGKYIFSPRKNITVSLTMNLSHYAQGNLIEYVPIDWDISDTDGVVQAYSQTHNKITWEIDANSAQKHYVVSPPDIILTKKYSFKAEFENITKEEKYHLYRFIKIPFLSLTRSFSKDKFDNIQRAVYGQVSLDQPALILVNDSLVNSIIIIPNKSQENVALMFMNIKDKRDLESFAILSSLRNKNINNIIIDIKVNKRISTKKLELYDHYSKTSISMVNHSSDNNYRYYQLSLKKTGKFSIKEVKR